MFPNHGRVTDLKEISTNIQKRDRTLRSFQEYEKIYP